MVQRVYARRDGRRKHRGWVWERAFVPFDAEDARSIRLGWDGWDCCASDVHRNPGAGELSFDEASNKAERIDHFVDHLLKETIDDAWTRAAVALFPLQGSETEGNIQGPAVDWVMQLQVTLEPAEEVTRQSIEVPLNGWIRCMQSGCELNRSQFLGDDLVMLVLITLKNDTSHYNVTVGCGAQKAAVEQKVFWTAMDHCSKILVGRIVDIAFLDF